MKIENFIVLCLIVFLTITNEKITTLRITNLNSNNNFLSKNNVNFSQKNDVNNQINNTDGNNNSMKFPLTPSKVQPPTFTSEFVDKPNLGNFK